MANIKDVAKLAGVSVTTVSRVLNNKGYISQDTYESVYRAIDQLDYVPNQIARNLFKQKSYYISLIVPDSSHPFWAEITKYMLAETDYQNLDLPIVALDYRVAEDIPTIYSDHNKGGLLAAGEILKNDCKCVLNVTAVVTDKSPSINRHRVFSETLKKNGVKCIDYTWDTKQKTEDYYQQMNELFDKYPEMDAMFSEDLIIMNALKCAGERGMHIPDEFKTVGYDGTLIAKMSYPSMTYISQPIKELADTLVDVLLKKINGAKLSEDIVLEDVCLVKGQTTE